AGCLILLCTLFSLGHLYALSLEVLLVGVVFYLLMFLLLMRFAPSDSYVVIITPLLFAMKMPYVVPIAVGLLGSPLSAISVACGVIVYYVLKTFVGCAPTLVAMDKSDIVGRVTYLMENLLKNKPMLVIAGSFAVTVIVVWAIHKMSIEHSWTIAMTAGVMVNLGLLLVGDLKYDIGLSLGSAIWGSILALLVAKVIEFFRFCVDYGRTERVQFEDDDYFYYVKAVPKMNVAAPTKTVKKIISNTQSMPAVSDAQVRSGEGKRTATQTRTAGQGKKRPADAAARPRKPQGTAVREQAPKKDSAQEVLDRLQAAQERDRARARAKEQASEVTEDTTQYDIRQFDVQFPTEPNSVVTADDEMGQTKAMPLAWNSGQSQGNVRSARPGQERSSRQSVQPRKTADRPNAEMTSGSATFGGTPQGDEPQDNGNGSDDYEELF
ncbi:MAG: hypothetical protein IKS85_02535, partial [Lachnospiraceae bacterium]|nr:hypothetical protein [Lachnospiraceae bacterium]